MRSFFGNKDRVDIAAAVCRYSIEPPETFRGVEVAKQIFHDKGVGANVTRQQLKVLESVDMIQEVQLESRTPGDSAIYYTRLDSPLWRVVEVAIQAVDEQFPEG